MLVPSLPKKSVIGASMSNIGGSLGLVRLYRPAGRGEVELMTVSGCLVLAGSEFIKNRMRLLGLFVENLVQVRGASGSQS